MKMNYTRIFLLLLVVYIAKKSDAFAIKHDARRYPVIIVPGDGGSQLEAKIDRPRANDGASSDVCSRKTDWFLLYLNSDALSPLSGKIDCFVDVTKLHYDLRTRTTHDTPGVQIRVPGFGNTNTVEWISKKTDFVSIDYFEKLVDHLVDNLGYVRGVSVRAAPYDFRKAANEMNAYFVSLKNLVEETYKLNNNQPIVLLGHSMGTLNILYFLNHQSQAWKDVYIKSFISIGGPYGGAVKSVQIMTSGWDFDSGILDSADARPLLRSMASSSWLLPYDTFWGKDEVLVYSPTRNYTVKDYKQLFNDLKFPTGYYMREDTEHLIKKMDAPGVEVHCLHGVSVKTTASLVYSVPDDKSNWFDNVPDIINDDGDGTVNLQSLKGCLRWSKTHKVHYRQFEGVKHLDSVKDEDVLNYISEVLRS